MLRRSGSQSRRIPPLLLGVAAALPLAAPVGLPAQSARPAGERDAMQDARQEAPAAEKLGRVRFPITCSATAQEKFEAAVALLHHMMYVEARSAFEGVAREDPNCAMAHWGIAMTLFQPLWPTRPSELELARGLVEVEMATAAGLATDRERAFVDATRAFFDPSDGPDYFTRLARFETAMERAYTAYPDDPEVATFYALAHLATASRSDPTLAHQERAAKILAEVFQGEPTHPGAIHYTIHADDVQERAELAVDAARNYDAIAPSVPHALHMPTHIYVRLGAWEEVIDWNRRSADAALERPAGSHTSHHYAHAVDYLIYAYLQRADDERAADLLSEANEIDDYQQTFVSAYALASMPARYLVERREWRLAATLVPRRPAAFPWESFPQAEALTHFARGLGAARVGDLQMAREALDTLRTLRERSAETGEEYWARQIGLEASAVEAWLAWAQGRESEALLLMAGAAELEATSEKDPVTPGALQPAIELMGDLFLEAGRPGEALRAYERSLEMWPKRFNSLLGAARAAVAAGAPERAEAFYRELLEQAEETSGRAGVVEARRFLSR